MLHISWRHFLMVSRWYGSATLSMPSHSFAHSRKSTSPLLLPARLNTNRQRFSLKLTHLIHVTGWLIMYQLDSCIYRRAGLIQPRAHTHFKLKDRGEVPSICPQNFHNLFGLGYRNQNMVRGIPVGVPPSANREPSVSTGPTKLKQRKL